MKILKKFFSTILTATLCIMLVGTSFCADMNTADVTGENDVGMIDVGDFGSWATENNRKIFLNTLTHDISEFYSPDATQNIDNYVPIEAKVGLAFMNGYSMVARVLDASLVRFVLMFIIIAYGFWVAFEAYTIITGQNKAKEKVKEIAKKGLMLVVWIGVLSIGAAQLFTLVISPIMFLGTYMSDLILNAVSNVAGINLPDTCNAIRKYAIANISKENIIDPISAANIMCVPTRMSGFCYSAIAMGWEWMKASIGNSVFGFLCGIVFVFGFLYLAWRYVFMAFGIIADLFLGIIMLPFTAIAETTAKTTYKGIAGNIFNGFLKLFTTESLKVQVERFINAALFFVILSIIISVAAGMLSSVVELNAAGGIPSIDNPNIWVSLLVFALTYWMAKNAEKMATDIGGKVSYEMGTNLQNDAENIWKGAKKTTQGWWKAIKESRKKK